MVAYFKTFLNGIVLYYSFCTFLCINCRGSDSLLYTHFRNNNLAFLSSKFEEEADMVDNMTVSIKAEVCVKLQLVVTGNL